MLETITRLWANKKSRSLLVFTILLLGGLGMAASEIFRRQVIFQNYADPPPIFYSTLIFEYVAFAFVVFLFPWSWQIAKGNKKLKIAYLLATCISFVILYTFFSSFLEWMESSVEYNLWKGFTFTLLHSGLFTAIVYSIFALFLFLVGSTKQMERSSTFLTRIAYKIKNESLYIETEKIILLEANGNYVSIYTDNGNHHLIRKTLGKLEQLLDPQYFTRVHRKFIIARQKIFSFRADPNGGYILVLKNEKEVKMSKSYAHKLALIKESIGRS